MTPIDLFDYTNTHKRIPAHVLNHQTPMAPEVTSYHILGSYMVDGLYASALGAMCFIMLTVAMKSFMITPDLLISFEEIDFTSFFISLMPIVFTSYFCASYFFNNGQTVGNKIFKTRISIPEMNYRSSLFWGLYSTSAVMSGGLTLLSYQWLQDKKWGQFKHQDHLYFNLMAERLLSPVDLVVETEAFHQAPAISLDQEEFFKAA